MRRCQVPTIPEAADDCAAAGAPVLPSPNPAARAASPLVCTAVRRLTPGILRLLMLRTSPFGRGVVSPHVVRHRSGLLPGPTGEEAPYTAAATRLNVPRPQALQLDMAGPQNSSAHRLRSLRPPHPALARRPLVQHARQGWTCLEGVEVAGRFVVALPLLRYPPSRCLRRERVAGASCGQAVQARCRRRWSGLWPSRIQPCRVAVSNC